MLRTEQATVSGQALSSGASRYLLLLSWLAVVLAIAGCDSGTPSGEQVTSVAQTPPLATANVGATITAISNLAMQPTPVGRPKREELPPPGFDACAYLSNEEVKAAIGKPVTSSPYKPDTSGVPKLYDNDARCLYAGDGENLVLTVIKARDEPEAASLLSIYFASSPGGGQPLPGVGDAAFAFVNDQPGGSRNCFMAVKNATFFFTVRWLSSSGQDDLEVLKKIGRAVLSHAESQPARQATTPTP